MLQSVHQNKQSVTKKNVLIPVAKPAERTVADMTVSVHPGATGVTEVLEIFV